MNAWVVAYERDGPRADTPSVGRLPGAMRVSSPRTSALGGAIGVYILRACCWVSYRMSPVLS
jgi:hypothetical protein